MGGKGPGTLTRAVRLGRAGAGSRTARSVNRIRNTSRGAARTFNADREIDLARARRARR